MLIVSAVTTFDTFAALQLAQKEKLLSVDAQKSELLDRVENTLARDIRCLWYEFTPFEIGSDEVGGEGRMLIEYSRLQLMGSLARQSLDSFLVPRTFV